MASLPEEYQQSVGGCYVRVRYTINGISKLSCPILKLQLQVHETMLPNLDLN